MIEYADGTRIGVCSLHCAALAIASHPGSKPKAILVADYNTKELINAETASWGIGGNKPGVMTGNAKWAFARKEDAENFRLENGGHITGFDEALQTAYTDLGNDTKRVQSHGEAAMGEEHMHMNHDMSHMGPGAQMLFNPAFGDDIYHTHPADMWMVNYKFMRETKHGLRAGTDNVDQNNVSPVGHKPFGYMMTPTYMTMDMQMLMVMYGLTDKLTLMATGSYESMSMDMLMNMGKGNKDDTPMHTNGIGDTELRSIYGIGKNFVTSLGVSLPTGDIRQLIGMMGTIPIVPYMTCSWDLAPLILNQL